MELDREAILQLCQIRDPVGVVSLYVCTTPDRQTKETPEWAIALRNRIRDLRTEAKENEARERRVALYERLDALQPEIEWLNDPKVPGRGRAVFAPVASDTVYRTAIQVELPDEVVFEETAYVRPLVTAFAKGRPAGIAIADRTGVRLLEWRFGEIDELGRFDFTDASEEWRELKGPAAVNPAHEQVSSTHRQLFEERLDDHRVRFLKTVASELEGRIKDRRWDRLVVAGESRLAQPFADALPRNHHDLELIRTEHELRQLPLGDIGDTIRPLLHEADERRELALVQQAKERGLGGGHGSVGLAPTLEALAEGRIQHLLYDETMDVQGYRTSDGRLVGPGSGDSDDLIPEPLLVERMIERSYETSAEVTPLGPLGAAELAAHDGVAAILRW